MAFIEIGVENELRNKISSDLSHLGKIYKAKKSPYYYRSVEHNLVEDMLLEGWEEVVRLKTKVKLRKEKSHSTRFEDDIWCQLYNLGYRELSYSNDFRLPFGKTELERKQIDIIAVGEDNILLIECKSKATPSKVSGLNLKTEFESLPIKLNGFRKSLEQLYGKEKRIKYIFATRNIRLDRHGADIKRLESNRAFFYNDNTYEYINSLIKSYKDAAHYQFLAILFKGESITKDRLELPAIEGEMGNMKYYMFSIEPHLLLKMGFILHRTRANDAETPTYQRLLVPSRLKGISKFINEGGYFPNSIILNFNKARNTLQFEASSRGEATNSRSGTLKISNSYAIAYIIDGQHRVYGYSQSKFKKSNTIPVVAFHGLDSTQQLQLFMDINENQKAVSPTLRITLEEDLFWNAERADSRMKALRSSIIRGLGDLIESPLHNQISIGEDKGHLSAKPFANALSHSSLLPRAKGNKFDNTDIAHSLYNVSNHNHSQEMERARLAVISLIIQCYELIAENIPDEFQGNNQLILSNRGTYAFICLIGALNKHESTKANWQQNITPEERFSAISKYLYALVKELKDLKEEEKEYLKVNYGGGADTKWFMTFQNLVNRKFPEFEPHDLVDWKERQNKDLQDEGRELSNAIERFIKSNVISNLEILFKENWDLEIGAIHRECQERANKEEERLYKEGMGRKKIDWKEMFFINDYKTIIERYWVKKPETEIENFRTFEKIFAIDIGHGFNSKSEKLKWMSFFNTYRNNIAHEGSKEKGLNRDEVQTLREIHEALT